METVLANALPAQGADAALVRAMATGDEQALRIIYARYAQRLFAYAFRLTGDRSLAEEVMLDSLLAAWQGARRFRGESAVMTWLLGIVHHKALNATRRKGLARAGLAEANGLSAADGEPEACALAVDRREAIKGISQTCRDLAVLDRGQLRSRGSPAALIAAAEGMVWQLSSSDGRKPDNGLVVVSTLHLAEGIQYRVVGRGAEAYPEAKPVRPSLEDGYVWLMQGEGGRQREGLSAGA